MTLWCAIRTFAAHAEELGNALPTSPIVFLKPASCLIEGPIDVTGHDGEVHHEVELVLRLDANLVVSHIAVGLDLTDRAAQAAARPEGLPWARGKAFRGAARVGPWVAWDKPLDDLLDLHLELSVDGELRQSAPLSSMSLSPRALLEDLRAWAPLVEGDLLFTGTPAGVGRLHPGEHVKAVLASSAGKVLSLLEVECA